MSDSETSSDIKVNYQNSNGENLLDNSKKTQSTDTDYYFNMIANPNKIIQYNKPHTETSEVIKNSSSSSTSSASSVKSSSSSTKKSSSSSTRHKYSDSKPSYEKISVSPKQVPIIPFGATPQKQNTNTNTNTNTNVETETEKPVKQLTPQEIRMKKIEILRKLCEIKAKGFNLSKEYDFNSSLDEMEYEYELLKSFADKRNGVKIFKSGLLQAVSVIEFLNDKYDPFDFHLSGWGEHMQIEADNWEDVMEEIYEKHKGLGKKRSPEIKLLCLIGASAAAFHFTKAHASKLPGLDSLLASNPNLLSKVLNPGKGESSQFLSPTELSIEKQRNDFKKKEAESRQIQQQQIQQLQEQINKQQSLLNAQTEPVASNFKNGLFPQQIKANELRQTIPNIRAPEQVKDILSRIHKLEPTSIKQSNTDTQDETSSNNDRLISDSTFSESNVKKRQTRKPRKANISIM